MRRPLFDLRLTALTLNRIESRAADCVVALGDRHRWRQVSARALGRLGRKATAATTLLANVVELRLDVEQGVSIALVGAKALGTAGVHA